MKYHWQGVTHFFWRWNYLGHSFIASVWACFYLCSGLWLLCVFLSLSFVMEDSVLSLCKIAMGPFQVKIEFSCSSF